MNMEKVESLYLALVAVGWDEKTARGIANGLAADGWDEEAVARLEQVLDSIFSD